MRLLVHIISHVVHTMYVVHVHVSLQFYAEDFESRNHETHIHHCRLLNGPLHDHISTTYGLTRDSSLNEIK